MLLNIMCYLSLHLRAHVLQRALSPGPHSNASLQTFANVLPLLQNLPSRTLEFHEGKEIIPVSSVCLLWGTLTLVGELSEVLCVWEGVDYN